MIKKSPEAIAIENDAGSETAIANLEDLLPPAPTDIGLFTESVTKTTFTETTTTRVTNNQYELTPSSPPDTDDADEVRSNVACMQMRPGARNDHGMITQRNGEKV